MRQTKRMIMENYTSIVRLPDEVLLGEGQRLVKEGSVVSVKPGTLTEAQEAELRAAYAKASENTVTAIPLDWQKNKLPRKWSSFEGIKEFDWD